MTLQCEFATNHALPFLRSLIAKELVNMFSYTQLEASVKLGTTQSAISQYLNKKRGSKSMKDFDSYLPLARITAKEAAKKIVSENLGIEETTKIFCRFCKSLKKERTCQCIDI